MNKPVAFALCLLVAAPLTGGEGATPIWEPTTITQPGHYKLTRNIAAAGTLIQIEASDVQLDLNGFTLEKTDSGGAAILVTQQANVKIRNGTVKGDTYVWSTDRASIVSLRCEGRITVEDSDDFAIRRNIIVDTLGDGIGVTNSSGTVEDNVIRGAYQCGMFIDTSGTLRISGNQILSATECGIYLDATSATVVGNLLDDCGFETWDHGLFVTRSGAMVVDNVVRNGSGDGIAVFGSRNHLERNLLVDNGGYGLRFQSAASDNVYRGNTARGNTTDFRDDGTANTSHGDNYMPNMM